MFSLIVSGCAGAPVTRVTATATANPAATPPLGASLLPAAQFDAWVDAYYAELPAAHPTSATELGIHTVDGELEDVSAAGVAREVARLRGWDARFATLVPAGSSPGLSVDRRIDLEFLRSTIAAALLELEETRGWQRHPANYSGLASRTIYVVIKRDFAPLDVRMRSVISREQKIPAMLEAGKANLGDGAQVARVSLDIALEELPGVIDFFARDVPLALSSVKDPAQRAAFEKSNEAVKAALRAYGDFLKTRIAPNAKADFAIGEALYRKKLAAEEMVSEPLDALLLRGQAELSRLQLEYQRVAREIDPKASYLEVQKRMSKDHPKGSELIATAQSGLAALRQFLVDKKLVGVPSQVLPQVQETPAFMRATTIASMETPGPFEDKATEAFYNITLPDPTWSAAQTEDYLAGGFNRFVLEITSIHEAYPGHYTQFLWLPTIRSKVRKYEGAATNFEGWAHYTEQMVLDEGWRAGDKQLRLGQLQDALLRAARFVVGIRMHTRGMRLDEAVAFFHKEGYQSEKGSEVEAKRGTQDPTYLYYTLGKLEIYKLREDYKKQQGASYTVGRFHDAFLAEGAIPLPLMRRALGL